MYQLEHFYYGPFVRDGKVEGENRVLALSAGLNQERAKEFVSEVQLPPATSVPEGTWAIVRSKNAAFLMLQAQRGSAGQIMQHYVVTPSEVLRALAGNLDVLAQWVEKEMPVYARLGDRLDPISLPEVGAAQDEVQIDHILELMTYTENQVGVIESLVAAVVQGVLLVVKQAPPELEQRVNFIKGLLALLPAPARFGVTFSTYSPADANLDAQIRFIDADQTPDEALVFNWKSAQVLGKQVEDDYSHYIVSQLRLDTGLVIQEMQKLTPVAAWRIKKGDTLALALGYASQRMALDRSLRNNLPVELEEVSKILATDRSLSEELRGIYADHVLSLALALGDHEAADPISLYLRRDQTLENATYKKLEDALNDGQSAFVSQLLTRWLSNPLGPQSSNWLQLTHDALLQRMEALCKAGDPQAVQTLLNAVQGMGPSLEIGRIAPRLIETALPISLRDKALARSVFILATQYLNADRFIRLLGSPRYIALLPDSISELVMHLEKKSSLNPPAGLLIRASRSMGEVNQPLLLLRFTEALFKMGHKELLDVDLLAKLADLSRSRYGHLYRSLFIQVVAHFSTDELLPTLEEPGPFHLLQILLLHKAYAELVQELLHQARLLYPGDLQVQYANMMQRLFSQTALAPASALEALRALEEGGIKAVPLMMAHVGALERHQGQPRIDRLAERVLTEMTRDPILTRGMQPSAMKALMLYFIQQKDTPSALRIAGLVPEVAVQHGTTGLSMMIDIHKLLNTENAEMQVAGLELLRRFVRNSDPTAARRALVHFGRELGLHTREALDATYILKRVMNGLDFEIYADFLHLTAELLENTAMAYGDRNNIPTLGALVNTMQSLSGGLMDKEEDLIASSMLGLGEAIVTLHTQYRSSTPRNLDKHIDQLIRGETNPTCGLDVLWIMGGYFAKGQRYRMRLHTAQHPFAERSAPILRNESELAHQLLNGVVQAFPDGKEITLTAEAIRGEVESIWGVLDEKQRKSLVRNLAIDFQRVVQLVAQIAEQGDARVVQPNSGQGKRLDGGKVQPRSTLEFYRYVYGYFKLN